MMLSAAAKSATSRQVTQRAISPAEQGGQRKLFTIPVSVPQHREGNGTNKL